MNKYFLDLADFPTSLLLNTPKQNQYTHTKKSSNAAQAATLLSMSSCRKPGPSRSFLSSPTARPPSPFRGAPIQIYIPRAFLEAILDKISRLKAGQKQVFICIRYCYCCYKQVKQVFGYIYMRVCICAREGFFFLLHFQFVRNTLLLLFMFSEIERFACFSACFIFLVVLIQIVTGIT
jgi:hypothetical protein